MQLKKLLVSAMCCLSFVSVAANANIQLQAQPIAGKDVCDGLSGDWAGGGTMTAKVLGINIECDYYGTAVVTEPSTHNYSADVVFDLQSGSALCPGRQTYTLPGTCNSENGAITLQTDDVDLWGSLSYDGMHATLQGKVRITIKGKSIIGTVNYLNLVKS